MILDSAALKTSWCAPVLANIEGDGIWDFSNRGRWGQRQVLAMQFVAFLHVLVLGGYPHVTKTVNWRK